MVVEARGRSEAGRGVLYGIGAYSLWGLSAVYWKWLGSVGAGEVIAHRVLWAAVIIAAIVTWRRRWPLIRTLVGNRTDLIFLVMTSALIAVNWSLFVWAVFSDRLLEASLGYYINPLVNVALGVLLLKERLSRAQSVAVGLAAIGVLGLLLIGGVLPWISLTLAITFGFYGYLRKKRGFVAMDALMVEMGVCVPVVLFMIGVIEVNGDGSFGQGDLAAMVLLIGGGLVTFVPLAFFGEAVTRVKLSTMGLMQYIAPSIKFLLAVFLYGEIFTIGHAFAFACIWTALAIYSGESLWRERNGLRGEPRLP